MEDKFLAVYDGLRQKNPDMPDYNKFKSDLQQNEQARADVYNGLKMNNPDMPDFETFGRDMGLVGSSVRQDADKKVDIKKDKGGFWDSYIGDTIEKIGAGASSFGASMYSALEHFNNAVLKPWDLPSANNDKLDLSNIPELKVMFDKMGVPEDERRLTDGKSWLKRQADNAYQYADVLRERSDRYKGDNFRDLWEKGDYSGAVGDVFLQASESLPQSLMAMFGGGAGLALTGVSAGTQKYDELDKMPDMKDLPEYQKVINAVSSGTFEALSEKLGDVPIGNWIKGLYSKLGVRAGEEAVKNGFQRFLSDSFKKYGVLIAPVSEGVEEVASQIAENATDYFTGVSGNPNLLDGVLESFVYGAAGGAQFVPVAGMGMIRQRNDRRKVNRDFDASVNALREAFPEGKADDFIDGIYFLSRSEQEDVIRDMLNDSELNDAQRDALVGLYSVIDVYKAYNNPDARRREKFLGQFEKFRNKKSGDIVTARDSDDNPVYVLDETDSGYLVMRNDGSKEFLPISELREVVSESLDEHVNAFMRDYLDVDRMKTNEEAVNGGEPVETGGNEATLMPVDGVLHYQGRPVQVVDGTEQEDGTVVVEDESGETMRVPAGEQVGGAVYGEEDVVSVRENGDGVMRPVVPKTEDGKPDYDSMSPEMFAEEFEKEFGAEAARSELERMSADIDTQVEKLQKKSLTNRNERAENMREIARLKGERESVQAALERYAVPEETVSEDVQESPVFSSDEEATRWVIENSEDLDEVLGTYDAVKGLQRSVALPRWQQELQGVKINPESFYRHGDRNLATTALRRGWLSKDGRSIDEVAHDLSNYGVEVTPQDIVDFMLENPSGRVRENSSELDALGQRFSELATKAAGVKIGRPESSTGRLFIENMLTSNNMEQLREQIDDAKRAEEEVLKSMAEQRDSERENDGENEEIKPIGRGVFGNIYDQFRGNAKDAINFLCSKMDGEAVGALNHPSVGDISIVWGDEKTGLDKIIRKHPEVVENLQGIIDWMDVVFESDNRIKLESPTHFAVISKEYKGVPRDKWLLTAYEKKESSESANSRMDVESNLDGKSDDTATRQNSDVSNVKDTEVFSETQESGEDVEKIRDAESEVELNPTDAQKEAGNYRKGHVRLDGYDITIENPKGSERSGVDANGNRWSNTMNNTYGYIRGTKGVDGDHIDVFLSDSPQNGNVYVVDQVKEDGTFDEHKVMYGFDSMEEAKDAYLVNYSPGWKGLGAITEVSKDEFRKWVDSSKRKTKPFSEYKSVKKEAGENQGKNEDIRFREVENYTPEEQKIIDRAKENGSYMKAPNGNPSNLNEKQWAQVRTKAFKDWFGDWENDPENASKVVDENGDPRVVYHGTASDKVTKKWNDKTKTYDTSHEPFTTFRRTNDGERNFGLFFNSDQQNAYDYGYNTYDVFLNLRNPLVIDANGSSYMSIEYDGKSKDTYEWSEYAENKGYDGVVFKNVRDGVDYGAMEIPTTDYVAFEGIQIKSATDNTGDFFSLNSDIRYRENESSVSVEEVNRRFNEELEQQINGELPKGHIYQLGKPSNRLLSTGFPNMPIELSSANLADHAKKTHHPFELKDVKGIVKALQNPIAVFSYGDKGKSQNAIVEIQKDGRNFLVGVHFNQNRNGVEVSSIRGIFPKDNAEWLNWISQDKGLYLDKEKIQTLINQQRKNLADVKYLDLDSVTKIVKDFENPTVLEGEISSAIDELSDELGVKVNKVKSRKDLPEGIQRKMRGGRYPGLFDPKTGEVYVVMDEITDADDAQATMLHEVVGHKGIRGLFGDKIGEFTKRVLDAMPADERKAWVEKYNGDEQLAAEEYVARFAEGYENPTMWEKLKAVIRDLLRDLGIGLRLSDNDLKYVLWKGVNGMKQDGTFMDAAEYAAKDREAQRVLFNRAMNHTEEQNGNEVKDNIERLFDEAVSGNLRGRPVRVGKLTAQGKAYLERISGLKLKDSVDFVLNPSDMEHIHKRHFGENEKDGRNIPLDKQDIRSIADVIANPDNVLYAKENGGQQRNMFFFLKDSGDGAYQLLEIYADRKGNLTSKSFFKSKEGVSQRADALKEALHITSETDGATLNSDTNVPKMFETSNTDAENSSGKGALFREVEEDEEFSNKHLNLGERVQEAFQDRMVSVKNLLDEVKRRGGKVTDYANPYVAENLATSKSKAQIDDFNRRLWEPLMEHVKVFTDKGKTRNEVDRYMMAKHAPERNVLLFEREGVENGSGMSDEEANKIVDDFEKDFGEENIKTFWESVRDATRFTTETWQKHGLIDRATKDCYDSMYEYYVPLRGWEESEADAIEYIDKSRGGGTVSVNKKAKGRKSLADSPLAYIANMAHSAIVAGNKNDIKRNVFEMMALNKNPDLYHLKKVYQVNTGTEENPVWVEQLEKPAAELWNAGRVKMEVNRRNEAKREAYKTKQHQVEAFVNGQKYIMEFNGNMGVKVANAINGVNVVHSELLQNSIGRLTRWMSANYTSRNPEFIITNFMRDFGYAVPAYWMKGGNAGILLKNMPKAFRAIHNDLSGKKSDSELQQMYDEFKMNGGLIGYVHMTDIDSYKKWIERDIRRMSGDKTFGDVVLRNKAMRVGADLLEYLAQMSENSTRFAVYMSERQSGKSATEAAYAAKEITTNFNRKGSYSGVLGSLYVFFNATMQGSANALGLAKRSPGKFAIYCGSLIAVQYLASALCRMFGGDDEIGENNYDRLADWVKYNNLVLPDLNHEGSFVTVPLPHFFRALSSLGVIAGEVMNGIKTTGDGLEAMFDAVSGDLTPVEIATPQFKNLPSFLMSVTPTGLKPLTEAYAFNRNFMNLPIAREAMGDQKKTLPQHRLAKKTTNPTLVSISKWLNEKGGGGEYTTAEVSYDVETGDVGRNGWMTWMDVNPAKFEHVFEGIFGGRLKFFNNVYKTVDNALKGEFEASTTPIVRPLYQTPRGESAWIKFYEVRDDVIDIDAKASEFIKTGNYDAYGLINYRNARMVETFKAYDSALRELNDALKAVTDAEQAEEIERKRDEVVKEFAIEYRKLEAERKRERRAVAVE